MTLPPDGRPARIFYGTPAKVARFGFEAFSLRTLSIAPITGACGSALQIDSLCGIDADVWQHRGAEATGQKYADAREPNQGRKEIPSHRCAKI